MQIAFGLKYGNSFFIVGQNALKLRLDPQIFNTQLQE